MSTEERLTRVEDAFVTLTRLAQSLDERLNTQLTWINSLGAAQANSEAKIEALTDAQIRTEATLAEAQAKTEAALARLAEMQARTDRKVEALAEAQAKTEAALVRLAESQSHTDQRLDALIDIVREGRNGKSQP